MRVNTTTKYQTPLAGQNSETVHAATSVAGFRTSPFEISSLLTLARHARAMGVLKYTWITDRTENTRLLAIIWDMA